MLPPELLPKTLYINDDAKGAEEVINSMQAKGISYPIILKPDIGERGLNVFKIDSVNQLKTKLKLIDGDVILQEYITHPLELAVLCYINPVTRERDITSCCIKEFLFVIGDGESTLEALINKNPRAILQRDRLFTKFDIHKIPFKGERILLEPIGNHSRGTKFLNANHLIDEKLHAVFLSILDKMKGVQFGRFDFLTTSIEDLREGRNISIIEFNGINSEPIHIYDPSYSVWKAYRDLWNQ